MPYGAGNHQSDPERQRQYLEEIARHTEVHPDMLLGVLGVEQVVAFDQYQQSVTLNGLLVNPLPPEFRKSDEEAAKVADSIANNTTLYDADLEDLIDTDRVVAELMALPATDERTAAMRARRTVFALAVRILADEIAEAGDIDEGAA